jgi:hypothetical protein
LSGNSGGGEDVFYRFSQRTLNLHLFKLSLDGITGLWKRLSIQISCHHSTDEKTQKNELFCEFCFFVMHNSYNFKLLNLKPKEGKINLKSENLPTAALPASGSLGLISAFQAPLSLTRQNYTFLLKISKKIKIL